ncbi:MAG: protein-L-isoaspartate O-methyltransferase [Gammaproteobacteria bacterium]|nr:protein-L-isoaspartate O-methyltransferase [Gammaproteobacteria bacterium]NNC77945.1 protein-L-isoaspartate O-methyltransferase [Woeseiaceae bacterium]
MNIEIARQKMIEQQVRAWDVLDAEVLDVFRKIPRETFVPRDYAALAFADTEIPIGHRELMMTPTVEGRLLQSLELTGSENILEVGTGTGFVSACLAMLGHHVTSIDIHEDFLKHAAENLAEAGFDNVNLKHMDAMQDLPQGSFDAIAVTGSIEIFDPRFVEALRIGGRMFIVVGSGPAMDARLVRRTGESDWDSASLFETDLRALVNGRLPPQFYF